MEENKVKQALEKIQDLYKGEPTKIAWQVGEQISILFEEYQSTYDNKSFSEFYKQILSSSQIPYFIT
ncbi:hypothetical protein [Crocosphaera sp.]|uniref:hypothetical protein n=1 Tax=Crocosphaera sp. TaxID=2729996 RepID=UPI003F1E50B0|nr:hypothetical protein [Crocosphaera sp.]